MKTYYMFGDSLMRGVMPDEAWNYHSSDAIGFEKMQAQYNMKFLNFAMPTFTSERVKMWLTQVMSSYPVPDVAFLECGGMTGSRYVRANVTMNTGTELTLRILRRIMRI